MYALEEALQASVEYFNGDDLAAKVFLDKYALRDEEGKLLEKTPTDMHRRLAKEFARIEAKKFKNPLTEDEIFAYFDKFTSILAQGSPMSAIGNKYQIQTTGNCYCIPPVVDSYAGILYADQQLVQLAKRRAGIGISLDAIRPKGMITKNAAKTTDGIGIFMERFSNSCREVATHGRRGALLLALSIHHPEIETFINIKRDLKKVTGANISIKFTDEFMKAVINDTEYEQRWPINAKEPVISKKIKAKHIWNQFIDAAWASAEPGALFWDTVQHEGLSDRYKHLDSNFEDTTTNPCQPAWAKVLTRDGIRTINDINVGTEIWSETGWTQVVNKQSSGTQKVYKYQTTFGTFYGTKEHKVLSNGKKIEAQYAETIDTLRGPTVETVPFDALTIMDGLVFGDGGVHKASNNKVYLDVGAKDTDYFNDEYLKPYLKEKCGIGRHSYNVITTIKAEELPRTFERKIPIRYVQGTLIQKVSFLRGLYTANGSVVANRVTLKATSFEVIETVQTMLSSIGIASYFTTNKANTVSFSNGDYECKQSYDLNISRDINKFYYAIGFIQKYKQEKLKLLLDKTCHRPEITTRQIKTREYVSEEEVFDITVNNHTHTYWTSGVNVSNCGEIPQGFDSCRLMALNLYSFVDDPFTNKAKFNFDKFDEHTQIAQRLMDDIIDLELEALDRIIQKVKSDPEPMHIKQIELDLWKQLKQNCINGRRTGLGITALGDTLAALNIKYGTDEATKKTEKIYKQLAISSMKSSCLMAKELGAFPLYDKKIEAEQPFLKRLFAVSPEVKELHEKYGRRNISLTTTAPTGSVSCLTQTSSGIEPVFALSYIRRRKVTQAKEGTTVDALGDMWEEFKVYHEKVKHWMEVTGEKDVKKSPYWEATANEIDWEKSVDMQAVAQKWLTHSVSKTCNLPKDTPKELVHKIYLRAWELGCKGFTIYRDGCRDGVLITSKKEERQKIVKNNAPKRPKSVPCDLFVLPNKTTKILVVVGKLNNEPYELFALHTNNEKIINNHEIKGTVTKVKRGHYSVTTDLGEILVKDTHKALSSEEAAITRLVSTSLRHGVDVAFVVQQLERVEGDWNSFTKAIARVLKKYIIDGTKVTGEECPTCGSILTRESGCVTCTSCGYSRCG